MEETLTDLMMKFDPPAQSIEYEGETVHGMYELPAGVTAVDVSRKGSRLDPVQSVVFSAKNAKLRHDGTVAKSFIFWSDTAPEEFRLEVVRPREGAVIRVWNEWESFPESPGVRRGANAWLGNCGMVVEVDGDCLRFRCSDGVGEVDFTNLQFDIKLHFADPEA